MITHSRNHRELLEGVVTTAPLVLWQPRKAALHFNRNAVLPLHQKAVVVQQENTGQVIESFYYIEIMYI